MLLGLQAVGQSLSKEIIYGTVMSDGYQKITKGAMWGTRPVAKSIYEGAHPQGYTVVILEKEYFVRFAENEHNNLDRNYIIFPKGSIVYSDDKTGQFYSALCGNRIVYIRPVELVRIMKVSVKADTVYLPAPQPTEKKEIKLNLNIPTPKKRGEIKVWHIVIPVGAIIAGAIYSLTRRESSSGTRNSSTNNNKWRSTPGGQGQDSEPNGGDDPNDPGQGQDPEPNGGPVDPVPNGG